MKIFYIMIFSLLLAGKGYGQFLLKGKVKNKIDGIAMPGVTIAVSGNKGKQITDVNGEFYFSLKRGPYVLDVFAIGYERERISVEVPQTSDLTINLILSTTQLNEVAVISNGYQKLAQGKVTGSFVQLDSAILNRRVSPDILSRLADVTPGLIFNKSKGAGLNDISIRGRSTLFANDQPLIVLDNFPYEGDLGAINPNDVESITVLKDAAAAAIWGARSGNGVIVITTKAGSYGQKTKVSLNSNFTYAAKPDLFYNPIMSSADYIEVEKKLFVSGFYDAAELSGSQEGLSPVIELLIAARDSKISQQDADKAIERLKNNDIRNDYSRYIYRNAQAQQYALQISGGTAQQKFLLSAGYDKGLSALIGNENNRFTLRGSNTYSFNKGKGELSTELYFIQSRNQMNNPGTGAITTGIGPVDPYARLVDENGNPVTVTHEYRQPFVDAALGKGLLDWSYNPLKEIAMANNHSQASDLRINSRFKYQLLPGLNMEVLYQYTRSNTSAKNLQSLGSYYTRNLINRYTQVNLDGSFNRAIPVGAIQDVNTGLSTGNSLRGQLNYQKQFATDHEINVLGGYEIRSQESTTANSRLYGFDPSNGTNREVDYLTSFQDYVSAGNASLKVPFRDEENVYNDRFISWYGNASYSYKRRYTVTGSARLDRSNIFGVRTNQKGVPLYSAGLGWNVSEEDFYKFNLISHLKVRATFGYNGNVDRSLSALATATYFNASSGVLGIPTATITNPPNPDLRWERVKIYNLGVDFSLKDGVLNGSIDVYNKRGIDLIGSIVMRPSSGIGTFRGNTANTNGKGVDVVLNYSLRRRNFSWTPSFMFSYIKDKVAKYDVKGTTANYLEEGEYAAYPYEGRPLSGLYSYRWAGLDPENGEPRVYLNGVITNNYTQVAQLHTPADLVYNGPARPTKFGALRNNFTYNNFSLSVNISYRLGYFFRRNSLVNSTVLNGKGGHADYSKRWQKPGDERFTDVPSLQAVANSAQDRLYRFSSILVEKGDHIRLQDINIGYALHQKDFSRLPFSVIRFYLYENNIGLLWTANKKGIDPDYLLTKETRSFSIGLKADF